MLERLTRPGRVGDGRWTKRELEASLYNWLELAKRECTGMASQIIEAENIDAPGKQPRPRKR
jgi:hypothetical protein